MKNILLILFVFASISFGQKPAAVDSGATGLQPANNLSDVSDRATARINIGFTTGLGAPPASSCNEPSEANTLYQDQTFWTFYWCPDGTLWQGGISFIKAAGVPSSTQPGGCNTADEVGNRIYQDTNNGGLAYGCAKNSSGTVEWIALGTVVTVASQAEMIAESNSTNMATPLGVSQAANARLARCGYEKTSATRLTIFPGASATWPCTVGDAPWQFTAPRTLDFNTGTTSDTGRVYVDSSGNLTFGHNTAGTFTPSAGLTVAASVTAWPANSAPLFTPSWVSNVWDVYAASKDFRGPLALNRAITCTGCPAQSRNANGGFDFTVPTGSTVVYDYDAGVVSTSSTNLLYTNTFSGNTFATGGMLTCWVRGRKNTSGGTAIIYIRPEFGGSTMGTVAASVSTESVEHRFNVYFAAASTQFVTAQGIRPHGSGAINLNPSATLATTLDTTTALTLNVYSYFGSGTVSGDNFDLFTRCEYKAGI